MEKKNFSAKEFNAIVKGAKVELNGTFSSPFVVCNLLNKAAKGDFSKIEGAEGITKENLSKVAKVLKGLHSGRYAFDICVFGRNSKGQICTIEKAKKCPKFGFELVNVNTEGWHYYKPITMTINGVFAAFSKVAKVDIVASEKAEKAAKKEQKKAEKAANQLKKAKEVVAKVFGNEFVNTTSDSVILEKYNIIKGAK